MAHEFQHFKKAEGAGQPVTTGKAITKAFY